MIRLDVWLTLPDGARLQAGEHVLCFDLTPSPPTPAQLAALGRKWGVSGAAAICDEVRAALAGFTSIAADFGVPQPDIVRFATDIERRNRP